MLQLKITQQKFYLVFYVFTWWYSLDYDFKVAKLLLGLLNTVNGEEFKQANWTHK